MFSLAMVGQNDFRKMNWGDTPEQLKSAYPEVNWEIETYEGYRFYATNGFVGGLEAKIGFIFDSGKLQSGLYMFQESHSATGNLYYEDFELISSHLNKKYDMERNEDWNNTSWQGKSDYIGFALAMGHVAIDERFNDNRTFIIHSISGDGLNVEHTLYYSSFDWVKAKKGSVLDDF